MGDATWGVKVSDELKDRIQNIIRDENTSSKDFIESLVSMYELNKVKYGDNLLKEEIEELESLTRRINSIFINTNSKVKTLVNDNQNRFDSVMESKLSLIDTLQENLIQIKNENEDIKSLNQELVNSKSELTKRVNELTEGNNNIKTLNEEYKSKIDTMAGIVEEYRSYKENYVKLEHKIQELSRRNVEVEIQLKDKLKEAIEVNKVLQVNEENHKVEIEKLNTAALEKLQAIKEKTELESDRKLLEADKKHQLEIQKLHDEYNIKVKELLAENSKSNDKVKGLLEQIEESSKHKVAVKEKNK